MKNSFIKFITSWLAISAILFIAISILLLFVLWSNLLPLKYIIILFVLLYGLFILITLWMKPGSKNHSVNSTSKTIGKIVSLLLSILLFFVSAYGYMGIDKIKELMGGEVVEYNHFAVISLLESEIDEITDLNDKTIEICYEYDEGLNDIAISKLKADNSTINIALVENAETLVQDLYDHRTEAIIIDTAYIAIFETYYENFQDDIKEIWNVDIDASEAGTDIGGIEFVQRDFLITKDCFSIYISGMDSSGTVASKSRTDVNLVVTVNPTTKQILMTSIPRDYFVKLADKNGKDKLTHSGIGGVAASAQTVANLLDIDIDYYVKVNFTSLVKIVDALGGVTVYSPVSFYTYHYGYYVQAGDNYFDGAHALEFVRERYALAGGDNDRVKNQQRLLKAMIEKACSPSIITNYTKLLSSLDGLFITNITSEEIISLVKMQIDDMASWTFFSQACTGSGQTRTDGYYMPGQALYYMIPNEDSVNAAHDKIVLMMNGETIE